jgi:TPR repeat protein
LAIGSKLVLAVSPIEDGLGNVKTNVNHVVADPYSNPISPKGDAAQARRPLMRNRAIERSAAMRKCQDHGSFQHTDSAVDHVGVPQRGPRFDAARSATDIREDEGRRDLADPEVSQDALLTRAGSLLAQRPRRLVERRILSAGLMQKVAFALVLGLGIALSPVAGLAQSRETLKFVSPEAALEHGLGAYRSGFHKLAEQALTYAADRGSLLGRYYLARLYADPNGPITDHAKSYELYRGIVEEHAARIDVDDDPRAKYVGKSLTALAGYVLRGLPEIGLNPNAERAAGYLQEAATFFRDQDAQFELAKLYLTGEGVEVNHKQATSRLSTLAQAGHAGAQAFLADLYWRGKGGLPHEEGRALALITLAAENAPAHERIWIEDIYQSIYCGLSSGVRQQAQGLIASFRHRYAPRPGAEPQDTVGLTPRPVLTCADGTPLPTAPRDSRSEAPPVAKNSIAVPPPDVMQGGVIGVGERR